MGRAERSFKRLLLPGHQKKGNYAQVDYESQYIV
jgi:hypothetical protein